MSSITFSRIAITATAVLGAFTSLAHAQYFGDDCNVCTPVQPVLQSCYQTVPVTEYQQVRQTVKRPVYRTEYVEQPVTVYKPVSELRTTEVPTVRYQNVTQYRTVHRDMGRWVTQYRPNPRMQPCQYDNRPGVIGWVNRTTYQLRNAFTPRYTAIRQYRPQIMACTVPQTRQVAVRGTRTVSYNVTRMVPTQTVQRRPVQRLSYVEQEVTVMRPRTTYRTVPIGTSVAYAPYANGSSIAYSPFGTSSVAYGTIDGRTIRNAEVIDDRPVRSALSPEPDDAFKRSADRRNDDIRRVSPKQDLGDAKYVRPTERTVRREPSTPTGGVSRFARDPQPTPARRSTSDVTQPAATAPASNSSVRPYEDRSNPAGEEPDPFNGNLFKADSASTTPPSRYLRTSLSQAGSPESNGWQASRKIRSHEVPKTVPPRISLVNR